VTTELGIALASARAWAAGDPDPETKNDLTSALERADSGDPHSQALIAQRFSGRLAFGTAGVRGPLGFGPQAMNRVVVAHTTAGLARFLFSRPGAKSQPLRVFVGCDARKNSAVFANDTAEVLSGVGVNVLLTRSHVPTPLVAFAVRHLGCDAGIMITASHNPAGDNGYKVYFGSADEGSQIVPPVDAAIEHHIGVVASTFSWVETARNSERVSPAPASLLSDYSAATIASLAPLTSKLSPITSVYTPLHGVGGDTFLQVLESARFQTPVLVDEQFEPDPAFPTVSFPNPEEKGTLDLAFAKARAVNADLIIAHDPDADRLAVALPVDSEVGYKALTGNQVGAILGWWSAERAKAAHIRGTLANSIVSSPVLGKIATHFGLDHVETLTGFKYVSRVPGLVFGFEEALGYLVNPDVVRDKDGISAGLAILDAAQGLKTTGKTLWDYLAMIEGVVGGFASGQITIKPDHSDTGAPLTDQLRASSPARMGEHDVVAADDFMNGIDGFPEENILRYYLSEGSRVIVRPSGTEPKVKVYLDTAGETRADAESALAALESAVRDLLDYLP
jgi:phosphomannomutase